jgi:hypothetical protein
MVSNKQLTTQDCAVEEPFYYQSLPAESRKEIESLVRNIRDNGHQKLGAVIDIGNDLTRIKTLLGHRNFLPWLRTEFQWSERTARNYMDAARFFDGKTAKFADLDLSTAYALAAKSTLEDVKNDLLDRAERGERITQTLVLELLAEGKARQKEEKKGMASLKATVPEDYKITSGSRAILADDAPSAIEKSPAEEVADAILTIKWRAAPGRIDCCDPTDVARLLAKWGNEHHSLFWEAFGFVEEIKMAYLSLPYSSIRRPE